MTVQEILRAIVDNLAGDDVESADAIRRLIQQLDEQPAKTLTFDATDAAGNPRVFAGMWRPPSIHDDWVKQKAYPPLTIYEHQLHAAWQRGDFDRPLYVLDVPA